MSGDIRWGNAEKTIIIQTLAPGWQWTDLNAGIPVQAAMMDTVDHKVSIIIELRGRGLPPHAFSSARRTAGQDIFKHANTHMVIVVHGSLFMRRLVEAYNRVFHRGSVLLFSAPTLGAARLIVEEHPPTV